MMLSGRLRLHDVLDVEAFCRSVAEKKLRSWGAYLRPAELEDLVSYLIQTCWELSLRYDRTKGLSFSTYAQRTLSLRVVDWYRARFGDSRYSGSRPALSLDLLSQSLNMPIEDLIDHAEELSEEVLTRVAVSG